MSYNLYSESTKWVPYEDTPSALRPGMRARWVLAHPLQRVVFKTVTVGELLLLMLGVATICMSVLTWDATVSGKCSTPPLLITFATAARNSPLAFLLGIPFERRVAIHRLVAVMANLTAVLHGVIAFESREATDPDNFTFLWTGLGGVICALLLVVFSLPIIRRRMFEVFYYSHWVLFTLYVVFLVLHTAYVALFGVALWLLDLIMRAVYTACCQPKRGTLQHVSGTDIVVVTMQGVRYQPGQYAFISLPELGIFQWHPMSFSSAPCEGPVATFHVRCNGDWGKRLLALTRDSEKEHTVLVDGAYGNTSIDIASEKYKHFLFVAGGIGVTPLRSIATSLIDQNKRGRDVQLEMHWSMRDEIARAIPMKAEHGLTLHYTGGELAMIKVDGHTTKLGRMDVAGVVSEFKAKLLLGNSPPVKVAVLFCGPGAMFTPLRQACKTHSSGLVSFDLHTETFEF